MTEPARYGVGEDAIDGRPTGEPTGDAMGDATGDAIGDAIDGRPTGDAAEEATGDAAGDATEGSVTAVVGLGATVLVGAVVLVRGGGVGVFFLELPPQAVRSTSATAMVAGPRNRRA